MFGWRKRNDGFEWRQYVRTTILVRREKRRQKIDEMREAAVNKVKDAGERGLKASAAGAQKVGQAARAGLAEAGRSLDETVVQGLRKRLRAGLSRLAEILGALAHRLGGWLGSDSARKAAFGLAALAGFWAAARYSSHGFDREATIAAAIAALSAGFGALLSLAGDRDTGVAETLGDIGAAFGGVASALAGGGGRAIAAATALLLAVGAGWIWLGSATRPEIASLGGLPGSTSDKISGRAIAVTGDTLKLNGRTIRLAGIEAPERDQKCPLGSGRTWACGSSAAQAMAARLKSRTITCDVAAAQGTAPARGVCRSDGADVAAALVQAGHVFAETGWFARYASEEGEARAAKAGLWRGDAERPSEFRSKRWEEARRAAPDGCPIKGQKTSDRRVYVLPWSPQYERVKVRTARGERWFCSEAEAQAAGWSPSEQS